MSWVVYALLAPMVFIVVNFIDKLIVEKEIRNPLSLPPFVGVVAALSGIIMWIVTGFPVLELRDMLLVMSAGALHGAAATFYYKALSLEETSKLVILFQLQPVVLLVLSFLVLGEKISPQQLVGFVIILSAAIALSINRQAGKLRPSAAMWYAVAVVCLTSAASIIFKFVVEGSSFNKIIAYESWGLAFGCLLVYLFVPGVRPAFHATLRTASRRAIGILCLNEGIFVIAKLLSYTAITLGPVALVSVLAGTQVFYGILIGWVLTVLAPAIYKESISRGSLLWKAAGAVVLFIGVGWINAGA
ncbi:MAG: EamA family transporter [Anaerolineae bacterium]